MRHERRLVEIYGSFCERNELCPWSADELLCEIETGDPNELDRSPAEITRLTDWLRRFIRVWERAGGGPTLYT